MIILIGLKFFLNTDLTVPNQFDKNVKRILKKLLFNALKKIKH